ncbi:hypothetical protein [Candidatus Methylospira mobilis]|nr:hypothetical protein [Candidatus Methylospira mobilis]
MIKPSNKPNHMNFLKFGLIAIALSSSVTITGCDDGSGGNTPSVAKTEAKISGSVADHRGPVQEGRLEIKDKTGNGILNTTFTGGKYTVKIPANVTYPIVLTAYPTAGGVSSDPIKAVVTSPIAERMDISSVTTYIVDNAIALGGLSAENIAKASGGAIGMRQSQGVSAATGGSGGGAGNSGGGAGQGGHAGHNMEDMRSNTTGTSDQQQ